MGRKSKTVEVSTPVEKSTEARTTTNEATKAEGVKRRKKPDTSSFSSYIYKVLKQVYPELGITRKSMLVLDAICYDIFERLCVEASNLARYSKKHTITSKEIQAAVQLVLPGELAKHATSMGVSSVTKFVSANSK